MKRDRVFIILPIIFLSIGILMVISGTIYAGIINNTKREYIMTDALVIYKGVNSNNQKYIDIEYLVNQKKYTINLNYYNRTYKEGSLINIYYNPMNPSEYISIGNYFNTIILVLFGSLFIFISLVIIYYKNAYKRLKISGILIDAKIDSVVTNKKPKENSFIIFCSYIDIRTNKEYNFRSKELFYDVKSLIRKFKIKTLPVYINIKNTNKYYVDVESLDKYK